LIFGFKALYLHLWLAFLSLFGLELANYIEHYGLERKLDKNGNYESI